MSVTYSGGGLKLSYASSIIFLIDELFQNYIFNFSDFIFKNEYPSKGK